MSNYSDMEELARDDSDEGRRQLLNSLTEMFLENSGKNTEEQSEAFGDIIGHILDDVVAEARLEFSEKIAPAEEFPKDVLHKLARDEVADIAAPVLQHSPILEDWMLIAIASENSDEHLLAISKRDDIHEEITDVLVERGSEGVVKSVAKNPGANFSSSGYNTLAKKAQSDEELQETLVGRDDINQEVIDQLGPFLSTQLRKRLPKASSKRDLTGIVSKAKKRVESALIGKQRDHSEANKVFDDVQEERVSLSDAVQSLADEGRPLPLAILISLVAGLPEKMVTNLMLKVNGMPIAITCRALGVEEDAFVAVAQMRCGQLKLPRSVGDRLSTQFAELDKADAERTLRFIKVRQSLNEKAA